MVQLGQSIIAVYDIFCLSQLHVSLFTTHSIGPVRAHEKAGVKVDELESQA